MRVAESHVAPGELIHMADRESDIFTLLAEAVAMGWRFIFRAAHDRALFTQLEGEVARLFDAARMCLPKVTVAASLSKRGGKRPKKQLKVHPAREGRQATLHMSAVALKLRRPEEVRASQAERAVPVNVVRVWEEKPPKGEAPVEWLLLTSEPIDTPEDIRAVVDGYRARWLVEEYFCALKTGCGFEEKQLESAHALFNLFAYCLVVAYVLLLARALARQARQPPATEVLTDTQLSCLRALAKGKLASRPTARDVLLQIAALGGHLKNNGEPGWRTLSRGWSRLLDAEAMYLLIKEVATFDQS